MPKNEALDLIRVRTLVASGEARQLREAANLSLSELARGVEVDPSTLWRWETFRRRPHGTAAIRYLRILDQIEKGAR